MKGTHKIAIAAALLAFVFGAFFLAGAVGFFFWQLAEGTRLSRLGYEDMMRRDYAGAVEYLTEASHKIVLGENRYWLYVNRGAAENHQKRYDEAISDFATAIQIDPSRADPYEWQGQAYEQKKELDKARADYDLALERDPNRGPAHLQRGTILYDAGEINKALADFQEVTRIWPNYAPGFIMRGRCYFRLEDPDLEHALASFDAALNLQPWNTEVHGERAKVYLRLGDSERAFFDNVEAQHLASVPRDLPRPKPSPSPFLGKLDLGGGLWTLPKRPDFTSRESLEVKVQYETRVNNAWAAMERGDYDKAIESYDRALSLDLTPSRLSFVTMQRGNCFWEKGEIEKAEAAYDEAIKADLRNAPAYVCRGVSLDARGESDDALKDYAEALRINPYEYFAYCHRGIAFFHQGEFKNALADFSKAIELSSTRPDAYLFRARLSMQRKSCSQAIADCSTAIEFHPDSFRVYTQRALAYLCSGKFDLAEQDLKTARGLAKREELFLHDSVAWFRSTCPDSRMRNRSEALAEAQRSCELVHWKQWRPLDVLATAEAEAGDFRKAVEYEEKALAMAVPSVYRNEVEGRLQLFHQHQPFREAGAN